MNELNVGFELEKVADEQEQIGGNPALEEIKGEESSSPSEAPDEHDTALNHNEYLKQYECSIKTMTWNRDSHGLFDYETRHLEKIPLSTETSKQLIRVGSKCLLEPANFDLTEKYGERAQLLFTIKKDRNMYVIESPEISKLKDASPIQKDLIMGRDMDLFYGDNGEQLLPSS